MSTPRVCGLAASHFDELGLDAVEAAVGAVQHLLQVRRVEPYGTERPPRQCDGHRRTGQRFLYCLFPGLDRLQQSAPQRLADQARQHAGLQRRQHPVDARSGRDELPHGRESRRVGVGVRPRRHGLGAGDQLGRRGPGARLVEQFERL